RGRARAGVGQRAALIEGKLYVAGGFGTTGTLSSGEVYDFNTKQWSPIASLNRARYLSVSFVGKDTAGNPLWFVIGGQETVGGPQLGAEVYDVHNNRWIVLDNSFTQNLTRTYSGGAVAGDYFYAVAGATPVISQRITERTKVSDITVIPLDQSPVIRVPATQIAVAGAELKFTVTANDLGSGVPVTITPS